jgi:hypothetical protein
MKSLLTPWGLIRSRAGLTKKYPNVRLRLSSELSRASRVYESAKVIEELLKHFKNHRSTGRSIVRVRKYRRDNNELVEAAALGYKDPGGA